jgi:Mn2+/Fe2+ NRAMP family transporter
MTNVAEGAAREAPSTWGQRLRLVGPGIVIAVTGVGAGDMISSLVAGTNFGTVLIWAIIIGALLKFTLTEGIGRWYMASGETILKGWHMLGRAATWYFLVYLFVVTFVFGAAVTSTAALGVDAMFPNLLPVWAWAALHGVLGFAIVGIGRYGLFEQIMKVIAAGKFGAIILLAILLTPSLTDLALGLVPRIPEGGLINALAITFPPMILYAFGEPVALVIIYASLGALFLPFLAITLMLLLNSRRVAPEYRNRLTTNILLAVSVIPFIVVGVQEVLGAL